MLELEVHKGYHRLDLMRSLSSLHHRHTYNSGMKEDPEVLSQTKDWGQQINNL